MRRPLNPEDDETISEWAYRDVMAETPPRRRPLKPHRPGVDETATAESVSPNPNPSEPATKERPELTDEQLQMARERAAEVARKAGVAESFATGIASDMDLVTGRSSHTRPSGAGARARQGVADIDAQIKAARQRAQELYGRNRDASQDQFAREKFDWQQDNAELDRESRGEVARIQREAAAAGAEAQRLFAAGEAEKARVFQEKQAALDRQAANYRAGVLAAGAKSAAAQARHGELIDTDVRQLSEDLVSSGAPGFYQQSSTAQGIAEKNPDDLPGFGYLGGLAPSWMVSDDGKQLRQSVGQMLAEYRKGVTGAGMSDQERAEYERITGLLDSGDEGAVRIGLKTLREAIDARVSARVAGSHPEAAAEYQRRQPWVKEAVDRASGKAPPAPAKKPADMTDEELEARIQALSGGMR